MLIITDITNNWHWNGKFIIQVLTKRKTWVAILILGKIGVKCIKWTVSDYFNNRKLIEDFHQRFIIMIPYCRLY